MVERQTIKKNIGWLALGNIIVKPLWFLLILFTARLLGAVDFGQFMLAISIVSIASAVLEGGVDILIVRELSSRPQEYSIFFGNTSILKLVFGVISSIAAVATCLLLKVTWELSMLVCLASLYNISNILLLHFSTVFRAFEILKYEATSMILEKSSVIFLCGGILLMHLGVKVYMLGYALAYTATSLATFMIILFKIGMPVFHIRFSYLWCKIIKPALPFAVLNLFTIIYFRSGTIMLQVLTGRDDLVGYYNAGYRLVESFMLFPTIIVAPIYPVISRNRENIDQVRQVMSEAARALFFIGISIALPIFIFREKITLLLFGNGYRLAVNSVGILSLTMIPISINFAAGSLVAALNRQKKSNIFVLSITIVNLILNYFAIKGFNTSGAALTTVITETLLVSFNLFVVRDYISWRKILGLFLRTMLPALLAGLIMLTPVGKLNFPIQLCIVSFVMLSGYFSLKLVTFDDLRRLLRIAL